MVKTSTPSRRKRRVEVQFGDDELLKLMQLAADCGSSTVAGYMRQRVLAESHTSDTASFVDDLKYAAWMRDYLYELNKIGVNLNQMTANLNSYGLHTRKIAEELQAIRVELNFHRDWFFARYDRSNSKDEATS